MMRVVCLFLFLGALIFSFIEKTNRLNQLRLEIPKVNGEVKRLSRENERLAFEIACYFSPENLFSLLEKKVFFQFVYPSEFEVIEVNED